MEEEPWDRVMEVLERGGDRSWDEQQLRSMAIGLRSLRHTLGLAAGRAQRIQRALDMVEGLIGAGKPKGKRKEGV